MAITTLQGVTEGKYIVEVTNGTDVSTFSVDLDVNTVHSLTVPDGHKDTEDCDISLHRSALNDRFVYEGKSLKMPFIRILRGVITEIRAA